jgi:hypothetical protein
MTGLLDNAIRLCDNQSSDQKWIVHNDETFVKLESHSYPNMCIQVENKSTCTGGTLVLGDCSDHESLWYFTGGQLISAYCWVKGQTNIMGISIGNRGQCDPALGAYEGREVEVFGEDMFMFIDERMIAGDANGVTSPTFSPTYLPTYSPGNDDGTDDANGSDDSLEDDDANGSDDSLEDDDANGSDDSPEDDDANGSDDSPEEDDATK